MTSTRLTALPIVEGVVKNGTDERVVWRDFRWNTGQITRMWLVDPDDIDEREVFERVLEERE